MKQIKLNLNNIEKTSDDVANILQDGGIVIYPTDTLYGLGANALDEDAIAKVQKIKKQSDNKPISVIAKDIKMVKKIACIDSKVEKILKKVWPGSITIVLRKKDIIPYILTSGEETIAIRISDNKFISTLMEKIDFPITATSANISGKENLLKSTKIIEEFKNSIPYINLFIDARDIKRETASTIIDLTTTTPKILRMGVVGKNKMKEFFEKFDI
ncbi:MAG: L-threonylcarbamoyladenylate synthase [Patescibacteria group bacterium]|nr:L-threonylcarbamoyladenylate synthase [Patescibacteria group bacterium]